MPYRAIIFCSGRNFRAARANCLISKQSLKKCLNPAEKHKKKNYRIFAYERVILITDFTNHKNLCFNALLKFIGKETKFYHLFSGGNVN